MSAFSLGSIDPLDGVRRFTGFDLPSDISVVNILGDGTTDFNAVLQSPGTGLPVGQLTGRTDDASLVAALRALRQSEEQVTFTSEADGSYLVVMSDLRITREVPATFLWDYSITLTALAVVVVS